MLIADQWYKPPAAAIAVQHFLDQMRRGHHPVHPNPDISITSLLSAHLLGVGGVLLGRSVSRVAFMSGASWWRLVELLSPLSQQCKGGTKYRWQYYAVASLKVVVNGYLQNFIYINLNN